MEYDGRLHIKLYHALDIENKDFFIERGNITFESTRSTVYAINQLDLNSNQQQKLKVRNKLTYHIYNSINHYDVCRNLLMKIKCTD